LEWIARSRPLLYGCIEYLFAQSHSHSQALKKRAECRQKGGARANHPHPTQKCCTIPAKDMASSFRPTQDDDPFWNVRERVAASSFFFLYFCFSFCFSPDGIQIALLTLYNPIVEGHCR
jgi:hypothetical protein